MSVRRHYTKEEQAELLSNPYTLYVTECKVNFTLAFKEFVVSEKKKTRMTARKIFTNAGYRKELFTDEAVQKRVKAILEEANSKQGLKETRKPVHVYVKKTQTAARVTELEKQVQKLQQQVEFLKKIRHLEQTGQLPPNDSG